MLGSAAYGASHSERAQQEQALQNGSGAEEEGSGAGAAGAIPPAPASGKRCQAGSVMGAALWGPQWVCPAPSLGSYLVPGVGTCLGSGTSHCCDRRCRQVLVLWDKGL